MTKAEFIARIVPGAKNVEDKCGIPYLFIVAQAVLESGWGKKAIGGDNIFGIKATKNWQGKKILVRTLEYFNDDKQGAKFPKVYSITYMPKTGRYRYDVDAWFKDYDNIDECIVDHMGVLLQPNFKHALGEKDPKKYAEKIQAGTLKYATAPNYAKVMASVIDTVKRYIV